jgi:P pilus assembly chaperone PapD
MKKSLSLLFAIILAVISPVISHAEEPPPGQIGVAPSMFELSIGSKPVNESIRLFNLKKKATKVRVEVYNWTLDANNEVKILPPDSQSLDQWMLINPLRFTVEPGQSQVVRFSIRPTVKPSPGEHRALVYFIEEPADKNIDTTKALEILFKLGVGVYGQADPVRRVAALNNLSFDKQASMIKAEITNSGNAHTRLTGNYSIWKKDAFPGLDKAAKVASQQKEEKSPAGLVMTGQMNQTPVLPGNHRTIATQVTLPKAAGNYIIAVTGTLNDKTVEKTFVLTR